MDNWCGFSPEDIKHLHLILETDNDKIKYEDECDSLEKRSHKEPLILKNSYLGKKNPSKGRKSNYRQKESKNEIIYPVPSEARIGQETGPSKTEDDESNSSLDMSSSISSHSSASQNPCSESSPTNQSSDSHLKTVTILVGEDKSYKMIHSSPSEELVVKPAIEINGDAANRSLQKAFLLQSENARCKDIALEHFQERQKLMEEQNKRKKDLLTKAIADRKRQTQFEAKKIIQIQEELSRLDALLSTDVSILRNQIEQASYEFNEAQKRYDKAECEFIEAKMNLFSKLERKELLTEHLCKIIETNEQRKAKKLSELMAKLEISDDKYVNYACEEIPVIQQAASLNELTYTACSTLKSQNPNTVSKTGDSESNTNENASSNSLKCNGINNRTACKSSEALASINLITAQNLDHRSDSIPCDLNCSEDS